MRKKKHTLTVYFSAKHVEHKSKRKNYEKMYCDRYEYDFKQNELRMFEIL